MNTKGLCFPSLLRHDTTDADFARFLAAEQIVPSHNPWPQLVDRSALIYAWSQPFIRGLYIPTSRAEQSLLDVADRRLTHVPLPQRVAVLHEYLHLVLDFTPAKELARLCLADAYRSLFNLFVLPGGRWDEEEIRQASWEGLREMNAFLSEITERMVLAEELLVTAVGFDTAATQHTTSAERKREKTELLSLEQLWVAAQGSEFQNLYYGDGGAGGFKKVARLLRREPDDVTAIVIGRLGIFLEPLEMVGDEFDVVAGDERCHELVHAVKPMKHCRQLLEWLTSRIRDDTNNIKAWRTVVQTAVAQRDSDPAIRSLWTLSRGSDSRYAYMRPLRLIKEGHDRHVPLPTTRRRWPNAIFYPQEKDDRWYITPMLLAGDEKYYDVLIWEAFRQQLDAGYGICCPNLVVGPDKKPTCTCQPAFKARVQRLARWAIEKEQRFGAGEWSDLAFPCRTEC